jgi:tetratricopeptide (TPR) repeat protein
MPDSSDQSHKTIDDKSEGKSGNRPRYLFEDFRLEIDPERVDDAVRSLGEQARKLVDQGRYTRVRLKYKGKPLMPDIPMGVFLATEAVTFWYTGLLRALVVNLGMRTVIEVEFIHNADEKVAEGIDLYMAGEVEAAEAKYREALRMKVGDPAALYNLGVLLRVTGRRAEAMECFEKAAEVEGHPDAPRATEALERMKRGPRTL